MKIPEKNFLTKLHILEKEGIPFVAFKFPNSDKIYLIFQNDKELYSPNFLEKGFLFSSFDEKRNVFLRQDKMIKSKLSRFANKIQITKNQLSNSEQTSFEKLVSNAISEIQKGSFQKVVLSRRIKIRVWSESLSTYFQLLTRKYPNTFCYVFSHPKVGKWAAATPERLLEVTSNEVKTMSLAGTKKAKKFVIWTKKEKEEQQIVTEYIENQLSTIFTDVKVGNTQTIKAGRLAHLCTEISCSFSEEININKVINLLHPTPAVCGFPTEKAKKFIIENENYYRDFYTGYCGLINFSENKKADLFVNLRCMQISENQINIYVGAGITADSNPEKEWQETQNKAQTMLQII